MSLVLIDARCVSATLHGMSRYISLLGRGLAEKNAKEKLPYQVKFLVSKDWPKDGNEGPTFEGFQAIATQSDFLSRGELTELPRVIREATLGEGVSLFHSPTFSSLPVWPKALAPSCPWVQTVHDLNHLQYGGLKEKVYYQLLLRPFARQAASLVTISDFSRRALVKWTGRSDIELVPNAIEPGFGHPISDEKLSSGLSRFGLKPGGYFFFLSNPKPHKNGNLLLESHRTYLSQGGSVPLVLSFKPEAGIPTGSQAFQRVVSGLGESDVQLLLQGARTLFFPSLYEGFGLPPLEGVLAGVRIVVSKIEAHKEALSDLGASEVTWVDPLDLGGWTQAFHKSEKGEGQAPALRSQEAIRKRYSTELLASRMDQIYRRVLRIPT